MSCETTAAASSKDGYCDGIAGGIDAKSCTIIGSAISVGTKPKSGSSHALIGKLGEMGDDDEHEPSHSTAVVLVA